MKIVVGESARIGHARIDSPRVRFFRRFRKRKGALVALVFLAIVVGAAIFREQIAPQDPFAANMRSVLEEPSSSHPLGTDDIGRDILSRVISASRVSLLAGMEGMTISLAIGLPLGLIAGFSTGYVDRVVSFLTDALMSFPPLIFAVVIVGILGPGLTNSMIAIGVVFSPRFIRIVRAGTLTVCNEMYMEAARMIGCSSARRLVRHVVPNIMSPILVQIALTTSLALLAEASLSFIGLGVQPPDASWGAMLKRAFPYLAQSPAYAIAPSVAITLVVLALNTLGDGVRDSLGRSLRS